VREALASQTSARTKQMRSVEARFERDLADLLKDLYYQQHLTLGEIAEQIEIPIGTLGSWMVRLGLDRASVSRLAMDQAAEAGAGR